MVDPDMDRTDWLNDERGWIDEETCDNQPKRDAHEIVTSLIAIGAAVSMSEMRTAAANLHDLGRECYTTSAQDSIDWAETLVRNYTDRAMEAYRTCRPYCLHEEMREELKMALEDLEVRE